MTQSLIVPSYAQGFARSSGESANPDLWRGLVGAWVPALGPSGGVLRDVSGYGNHGALTNMVPADDWQIGERGMALDFDGSNDFVALGTAYNDVPLSDFSVGISLNADSATASGAVFSFQGIGGSADDLVIYPNDTGGATAGGVRVFWRRLGGTVISESGPNLVGIEQYLVIVRRGDHLYAYRNGLLVDDGALSGTPGPFDDLLLGEFPSQSFNGQVSNVQVYNRALTSNEISQLYIDPLAPFRMRDSIAFVPGAAVGGMLMRHPGMTGGMQQLTGGAAA